MQNAQIPGISDGTELIRESYSLKDRLHTEVYRFQLLGQVSTDIILVRDNMPDTEAFVLDINQESEEQRIKNTLI